MQQITVRHRIETGDTPAFSARSFRALSGGGAAGGAPLPGFADAVIAIAGATLAEAIYLSGLFAPPALCSGMGRCGLCRVRFLSEAPPVLDAEKDILSRHDLDAGWRLACRRAPEPGARVLIPALPVSLAPMGRAMPNRRAGQRPCGLAVDLGTTSVHWRFAPLEGEDDCPDMPCGSMTNPQMGAGSDVVSRLGHAATEQGAATLRRLVSGALLRLMGRGREAGFDPAAMCVAANPAMAAIFLGQDTASLARAPYSLPDRCGKTFTLPGMPPVYVPPHVSPFVGADISAGYASLALYPGRSAPEFPFILADLGTNGECVLALSPAEALVASLPMGPALEGINLSYGSEAAPGAVTEYALTPHGLEPMVMGGGAPQGITATGYLSLIRALRAAKLIGEDGLFNRPESALSQRVSNGGANGGIVTQVRLPGKMILYASDVEEILKVKAAFTLAVSRLLREASLPPARVKRVFLAGSLGSHVQVNSLTDLGFLPPGLGFRVTLSGNTSLAGAALLLRRAEARETCAAWAGRATALDLAGDPSFGDAFAKHMVFAWRS